MIYHDDELDDQTKKQLSRVASAPPRDHAKAAKGREIFMHQVRELQTRTLAVNITPQPKNGFLQKLFGKRFSFAPFTIALLLVFSLILGGWSTVYAAESSLPNDFLYPVKLTTENFRLAIAGNADSRISLLTTFSERRIDEANTLASEGELIPEELPVLLDEQMEELFTLTASMDDAAMQEALKGIQIHLRDQDQLMTNAMRGLPEGADPQLSRLLAMLKERQQLVQTGLGEPNTFQQQFRHQQGKSASLVTPTLTSTITNTLITTTPEITVTLTLTSGQYGPGPCETPGDCTPPGPFGTPIPGEQNGFGPGSDQGDGPHQPTITPMNGTHSGGNKNKNGNKP